VTKITRHTVEVPNFTGSLLMLFFVQSLSVNSVINCYALKSLHSDRLLTEIFFLYLIASCWRAVWGVIFKICVIFGVRF